MRQNCVKVHLLSRASWTVWPWRTTWRSIWSQRGPWCRRWFATTRGSTLSRTLASRATLLDTEGIDTPLVTLRGCSRVILNGCNTNWQIGGEWRTMQRWKPSAHAGGGARFLIYCLLQLWKKAFLFQFNAGLFLPFIKHHMHYSVNHHLICLRTGKLCCIFSNLKARGF